MCTMVGVLNLNNETMEIPVNLFERILDHSDLSDNIWPEIATLIGKNYHKRCCANCQHSLMCKIKDIAIHDMLIKAEEFACNMYMLNNWS